MVRALVSAEDVNSITRTHADRVYDLARRLGRAPEESAGVVEHAAVELIEDLARRPETVGDLVGGLFARARAGAHRGGGAPGDGTAAPPADRQPGGALRAGEQGAAVRAALEQVPEPQRFAVLVRDRYGLTPEQAAVACDREPAETARTVALGRIALVAAVEGGTPASLAGHDVAVGDLGQLADGTAPAGGRFGTLRRHVAGCALCAAVLDVQTRGAAMLAALPLNGPGDQVRSQLLQRAAARATALLPTAEQVRREIEYGYGRAPLISPLVIAIALLLALLIGGVAGVLLARGGTHRTGAGAPGGAGAQPCSISATRNASSRDCPMFSRGSHAVS